jgi:rare lipoprotein A
MMSLRLLAFLAALAVTPAQACTASYYGGGERLSRHTANGERFSPHGLTAAHRTLPFGTRVRVSLGGRSVVVRINDRGPAKWTGRCIDLSKGAARVLGMIPRGVARVQMEVLR